MLRESSFPPIPAELLPIYSNPLFQKNVRMMCIQVSMLVTSVSPTKAAGGKCYYYMVCFRQEVVSQAREIGLDPAYVYGLISQESRFIMDARSHVGASLPQGYRRFSVGEPRSARKNSASVGRCLPAQRQ